MKSDSFNRVFSGKTRILIVMPHPDDTELYAGGTIARLIAGGIEVISVKMTNGGKGSRQTDMDEPSLAAKRSEEDKSAAVLLGIRPEHNIQLGLPDGEIETDLATIEKLALIIRTYRPDLVMTCNPENVIIRFYDAANWISHRDHRATAQAVCDAAYPYSRDHAFFPHQLQGLTEPYKPTTEFLLSDYYDHPEVVHIDITDFVETKRAAWRCHESAYTSDAVDAAIAFLNKEEDTDRYFETFRYVIAD